jgi:diamine N-acetyltransferase
VLKRRVDPLAAGRVRLRLLEPADLPLTLSWRNQDEVRRWFFNSNCLTPEQHAAWYAQYAARDDDFVFIIEETEQYHKPIGQVALYHMDWAAGRAEFGRLMIGDPAARGQGLARAATRLLVETALAEWKLHEIYLEVYADNQPALAIYTACGFEETGRLAHVVQMIRHGLG